MYAIVPVLTIKPKDKLISVVYWALLKTTVMNQMAPPSSNYIMDLTNRETFMIDNFEVFANIFISVDNNEYIYTNWADESDTDNAVDYLGVTLNGLNPNVVSLAHMLTYYDANTNKTYAWLNDTIFIVIPKDATQLDGNEETGETNEGNEEDEISILPTSDAYFSLWHPCFFGDCDEIEQAIQTYLQNAGEEENILKLGPYSFVSGKATYSFDVEYKEPKAIYGEKHTSVYFNTFPTLSTILTNMVLNPVDYQFEPSTIST